MLYVTANIRRWTRQTRVDHAVPHSKHKTLNAPDARWSCCTSQQTQNAERARRPLIMLYVTANTRRWTRQTPVDHAVRHSKHKTLNAPDARWSCCTSQQTQDAERTRRALIMLYVTANIRRWTRQTPVDHAVRHSKHKTLNAPGARWSCCTSQQTQDAERARRWRALIMLYVTANTRRWTRQTRVDHAVRHSKHKTLNAPDARWSCCTSQQTQDAERARRPLIMLYVTANTRRWTRQTPVDHAVRHSKHKTLNAPDARWSCCTSQQTQDAERARRALIMLYVTANTRRWTRQTRVDHAVRHSKHKTLNQCRLDVRRTSIADDGPTLTGTGRVMVIYYNVSSVEWK